MTRSQRSRRPPRRKSRAEIPKPSVVVSKLSRRGSAVCLLCGRVPVYVGYWIPTLKLSRELGAAGGKIRVVSYLLCKKCSQLRDHAKLAQDKILSEAAAGLANPEAN